MEPPTAAPAVSGTFTHTHTEAFSLSLKGGRGGPCGAGMGGAQIMEPRKEREGKREREGRRRSKGRKATSRRKRVFIATLDS